MGMWFVIPAIIAIVIAVGRAMCLVLSVNPHVKEMFVAAGVCLLAGELALIPIRLTRGASQIAVAQAALVATMVHLFACAAVGGALVMLKPFSLDPAVVYWLLCLYWATLIGLVMLLVRAVKRAPVPAGDASKPK